ncbi:4'-phosphopantetheinyl transferase superfamily protein [Halostella sp. PRR32]|uniref:holo-ACP synthase n=1 Tax=Halostella sp. PRR32 TaxID=3098147 RepID=UPI002B1DC121|nr:4'-phosphopantetheinyl transferase superfamily protein [Halostella sp. PRR32]
MPENVPDPPVDADLAVSHGVDVVSIARIADLLAEFGDSFRDRVFTPDEQAYCESQGTPQQHYAARWAAKEAFLKSLSDPSPSVPTAAIEIERRADGPRLSLAPAAADALAATLDERGVSPEAADTAVSLSHDLTAGYAVGSVTVVSTASRHD